MSCSSEVNCILGSESRKAACSRVRWKKERRRVSAASMYNDVIINRISMLAFAALKTFQRFCQMKYYKEIAHFLKIKVPTLNQEIKIDQEVQCVVHGIKKLEQETVLSITGETTVPQTNQNQQNAGSTQAESNPQPVQPLYIYQKYSQEVLPFGKALSISKTLQMDLSLMREGKQGIHPILTMSTFRKHVYSEYFMAHIKRRGKQGWKSIRLGQRIEDNDIKTKIQNINRMVKAGERRFKLHALNDSQRSQRVLIQFGKLFGKEVEPYLHTVTNAARKKEERWNAELIFEEEVDVDIDQVNKKWRRRQFEQQAKRQSPQQLKKLFEDEDVRMQRELYNAYKDLNIQMPSRFQKLAQDQRNLQNDRYALYRSAQQEEQQQWDQDEEQSFKQKMDRYNRQYFKERTATQIIEQMQELKRSGYQSEAHKVARFKQLKQQLQAILKKHNNDL